MATIITVHQLTGGGISSNRLRTLSERNSMSLFLFLFIILFRLFYYTPCKLYQLSSDYADKTFTY